jgi:hypothetical protein
MVPVKECAEQLYTSYDEWRIPTFTTHITPSELYAHIATLDKEKIQIEEAGESYEHRPLYHLSIGNGKRKILLWTQMHGDESTATKAVCDVLSYLQQPSSMQEKICKELSLHFLPMVNPDGAERNTRRNAQNLDINRDAASCQSIEARFLHGFRLALRPEFGFNLHDQELSTVGNTKDISALAFLAPAFDAQKTDNETRRKAKHLAATLTATAQQFMPQLITRYNDDYEPRAFGDRMQYFNVSTILIEAGHAKADREKKAIRKLYSVCLLSSLYAIATNEYSTSAISLYDTLPFNGKKAYDIILRNAIIKTANEETFTNDIAISYQVDTHSEYPPKIVDIGDLSTFASLHERDASRLVIPLENIALQQPVDINFFHTHKIEIPNAPW